MEDLSPFPFQGPLEPMQVSGRGELCADLAGRVMQRRLTALLGPRRFGKTSVLRRVTSDLANVGPETIWIDLYELSSMADFANALDRGLAQVTGKLGKVLGAIAEGFSLNLGMIGVELKKGPRDRPDAVLIARSLVDVLVRTAQRHDVVVVFDEFSGVADIKGAAGILRTGLQHHYRELGIIFAGSQPSTMQMLFSDQSQPFFAQADLVKIEPLTDRAVSDIVEDGFARTNRDAGAVTRRVVGLSAGHPQRAMQLADAAWNLTAEGDSATDDTWLAALAAVRATVDYGSERLYEVLPAGRQKTLRVVANGGSIYGTAASVIDLAAGTAQAAVSDLLGSGDLVRQDDRLVVVDPLFADWIRRRFPF